MKRLSNDEIMNLAIKIYTKSLDDIEYDNIKGEDCVKFINEGSKICEQLLKFSNQFYNLVKENKKLINDLSISIDGLDDLCYVNSYDSTSLYEFLQDWNALGMNPFGTIKSLYEKLITDTEMNQEYEINDWCEEIKYMIERNGDKQYVIDTINKNLDNNKWYAEGL